MQEYQPAPEVEDVARRLIDDFHTHLATVRIEYVFTTDQLKEKGKVVWGRAKKVSGLNAWLASEDKIPAAAAPEEFFVIEIHKGTWQTLDEKSKKALVDHELHHLDRDLDTGKLAMNPHDLEEFNAIVRRYGLWRDDVEFFIRAAKERDRGLFDADEGENDREPVKVTMEYEGETYDITDKLNAARRREARAWPNQSQSRNRCAYPRSSAIRATRSICLRASQAVTPSSARSTTSTTSHDEQVEDVDAVALATAEKIVRAYNSHDGLLTALETLLAAVKTVPQMNDTRFDQVGIQVNTAIAKAKGAPA